MDVDVGEVVVVGVGGTTNKGGGETSQSFGLKGKFLFFSIYDYYYCYCCYCC